MKKLEPGRSGGNRNIAKFVRALNAGRVSSQIFLDGVPLGPLRVVGDNYSYTAPDRITGQIEILNGDVDVDDVAVANRLDV